jgi:hypothetical protein
MAGTILGNRIVWYARETFEHILAQPGVECWTGE